MTDGQINTQFAKWYNLSLKQIAARPRSEKELWDYLKRKKVTGELIEKIVSLLLDQGFLGDLEFTAWWIDQRVTFRPKSTIVLRQELRQKGVSNEVIDEVLTKEFDRDKEREGAIALARKKWRFLKSTPQNERKIKTLQFLLRKGFTLQMSKQAISNLTERS